MAKAKVMDTKKKVDTKAKVETKKEVATPEVKTEEVKTEEVKTEVEEAKVEEPKVENKKVENKKKKDKAPALVPMTNSEMKKLFEENGCRAESGAKDSSNVVYQQWGTKSRVLQQSKAYQLLLTNGHTKKKDEVVASDNDDTKRFQEWYAKLTPEQQKDVIGYEDLTKAKLSASEMPRERQVKLRTKDLLVAFIKFMSGFEENKKAEVAAK